MYVVFSSNKLVRNSIQMIRRPATNQLPLDVPSRPFLLQETTKQTLTLDTRVKMFLRTTCYTGLTGYIRMET